MISNSHAPIAEQGRISELGGGYFVLIVKQRNFLEVGVKGLKPLGPLHVSRRRRIREPNGTFAGPRLCSQFHKVLTKPKIIGGQSDVIDKQIIW